MFESSMTRCSTTCILFSAFVLCIHSATYDGWVTSDVLMPRGDRAMAIGSHDSNIYILGGKYNLYQLIHYDISNDVVIDHGKSNLSAPMHGWGQFYRTQNNVLYMAKYDALSIFDMSSKSFTERWQTITYVGIHPCVATSNTFLFIVGGGTEAGVYIDTVQILSLANNEWLIHPPSMNTPRGGLTCQAHPQNNLLYAIAGITNGGYLSSVETLNISNIQSWQPISATLLYPATDLRSVIYNAHIIMISGYYDTTSRHTIHEISVLDVSTHQISSGGSLGIAMYAPATTVSGNTIYVFGGGTLKTFRYLSMPTVDPTSQPTRTPTNGPTAFPTSQPTNTMTDEPTLFPTSQPTAFPTNSPTTTLRPFGYIDGNVSCSNLHENVGLEHDKGISECREWCNNR
eukprot:623596_1